MGVIFLHNLSIDEVDFVNKNLQREIFVEQQMHYQ